MFRYRVLLLSLLALLLIAAVYGLRKQAPRGPSDLVPILCHKELGVGLLFITIENRGKGAGPSTMTLVFNTTVPPARSNGARPQARLAVKTPSIPPGTEAWIVVELMPAHGTGVVQPEGKVTITTVSTNGANNTLVTSCNDHT